MKNIQKSAAGTCVQRIDPSQVALAQRFPSTLAQLNSGMSGEAVFTKGDFEEALRKASRKVKK